jgi:hypothetical protein
MAFAKFDSAKRSNLYRSLHLAFWIDLMLGSVPHHHPDALPSIAKLQFAQSKEINGVIINLTNFLIVWDLL